MNSCPGRRLLPLLTLLASLGWIPAGALAQAPTLVTQPAPTTIAVPGDDVTLEVVASGNALAYQWRFNGVPIPDAVQPAIRFPAVAIANAGSYSVQVRSGSGESVVSRAAVLDVQGTGGSVSFSNATLRQPVWDADGVTPLAGDAFLAQLYAGAPGGPLAPVGAAVPFNSGTIAGYWRGGARYIPAVVPGSPAAVQVRVWESGRGRTFEEAQAVAGKLGMSPVIALASTGGAGTPPTIPSPLTGFTSFRVNLSLPPVLVDQPVGVVLAAGGPLELSVTATGGVPMTYQWQRNGVDVPGATLPTYRVEAVTAAAAGSYRVRVANAFATVLSAMAVVAVDEPGGTVQFSNVTARAPVSAEDGVTLLAGDAYLAQLYAGPDGSGLAPVSAAVPFSTGTAAGYVRGGTRSVPGVPPGGTAAVQIRVWETSAGGSFEAAVAAGRPVGLSTVLNLTLGGVGSPPSLPAQMLGLLPFSLSRQVAPVITQPLVAATVVAGANLQLTVGAAGVPPLTYHWSRDGVGIAGAGGPSLQFPSVTPTAAGAYRVVVRNPYGEAASGPVAVTVLVPPSITQEPVARTVIEGSPVSFSVAAAGTAPLAYQWRRGGVDLPGQVLPTLTIASAGPGDEGDYTVRVANVAGSVTSTPAQLRVVVPPSILTQPADVLAAVGDTVVLSVGAGGSPVLAYQWEFNGQPLPGATGSSLALGNVGGAAAGSYRVRVSNPAGVAVSRFAVLGVLGPGGSVAFSNAALRAAVTAEDTTTLLAGDAYLAQLYAGSSPATLQPVPGIVPFATGAAAGYWRGGTRFLGALPPGAIATLQVRVWETSAGATWEQALAAGRPVGLSRVMTLTLGGVGTPPTLPAPLTGLQPFSLTRQVAPQILAHPAPVTAIAGQPLRLAVEAFGLEPLVYEWRRDGTLLPSFTLAALDLPAVQPADAGDYAVTVRNAFGQAVGGPARVTVLVPPAIVQAPVSQAVVVGSPVSFAVGATGTAPLQYQWRRNGVDLPGATNSTLNLPSAQAPDAGEYAVRVTNAAGSVTSAPGAVLAVLLPPVVLTPPPDVSVIPGETIRLPVEVSGSEPLEFQWEWNGRPIPGATARELVLHNAVPQLAGSYRVAVRNAAGSALSRFGVVNVRGPGGTVQFSNASGRAPVTGLDGVTLLAGDAYLAQLYAGPGPDDLQPVAGAVPFAAGAAAGFWRGGTFSISSLAPGTAAFLQARVWETAAGATFEEAYAAGRPVGLSPALPATLGGTGEPPTLPAPLAGLLPFSLRFWTPPSITTGPVSTDVIQGQPLSLSVVAAGTPTLRYRWSRSGTVLPVGGAVLQVPAATPADAGDYTVEVLNDVGRVAAVPATVRVLVPPSLTRPPEPRVVVVGQEARFTVAAAGTAPLTFQWLRQGQPVPGATEPEYAFRAAATDDQARLAVRVSNAAGSILSAEVPLTVLSKPYFITPPVPVTATAGEPVQLSVTVGGAAPIGLQWQRNGADLPGANGSTLLLPAASAQDSDTYRVIATNPFGTVASASAVVVVNGPGGTVQFSNVGIRAPVTDTNGVTLLAGDGWLAQLYAGTDPFQLAPVPGAAPFATGAAAGFWIGGSRSVPHLAPGSTAFLQVRVWEMSAGPTLEAALAAGRSVGLSAMVSATLGGSGSPPSLPVPLTGVQPFALRAWARPVIVAGPAATNVILGNPLTLPVEATGSAPLAYLWRQDGNALPEANGPTLRIDAATPANAGAYAVSVRNWLGEATAGPIPVGVLVPPSITRNPGPATLAVGGTIQLIAAATGSAPLAYQWRRDGVDIPGATGPSFEKSGATPADSGNYSVRVANAAGSAESAPAALLVLAPPVITRQPAPLTLLAGLAATFTVEAAGSGTLTYQWFREEVALEGASGPVLNLPSLLVSDTATYRVRVGNLAGEALSTAVLLTVVTPPTILGPPVSQVAAAGAPVTLSVVAAGTGPLAYQWARNGVPLPSATSPALAIAAVSAADAGSYTVTVSNPHGTATPPAATLDVDLPVEFEGVAVDGYIAGATVFFDALRNGTPDPGEPFARTDAQGRFRLDIPLGRFDLNRNGRLDPEEGRLVRLGGIDVATGLAARFPATGPVGAGVLGPLSSLVDTLQASQPRLSVAEAESLVARSLGLPEDTAVTRVDPIQAAAQGQPAAIALLNAAAQVQDTLVQVASVLDAAAGGSSTAPGTVLDTLARSVLEARPLDLTEPGQIQEILQQAARKEGLEIPAGVADATAQVVAEGNQAKETATQSGDPRQVAEQISRIQSVAQGSTTRDLAEAATGRQDETEVLARNTGGPLQQLVAQAPAGDLLGTGSRPGTFSFSPETPRLAESGLVIQPLTIQRSDGNRGLVRVTLSISPDSATAGRDYRPGDLFLDFADGEIQKTVDLAALVVDDALPEPAEAFVLTLRLAPGSPAGARTGERTTTRVTVDDDDRAGAFAFSGETLEMNEDGTLVRRLFIERTGGLQGTVRLRVTSRPVSDGATPGTDYAPDPLDFTFEPGQRLAQVTIPVVDDALYEAAEAVDLELALAGPAVPGTELGARTKARLLVLNNDRRLPDLRFAGRPGDAVERATVRIAGPPGQRLGVETSDDLLHWTPAADAVIGVDGTCELPVRLDTPEGRFFRVGPKR